ncbi:peptidoglycan-binding domain-containing protein [Schaalia sp. lx-260]|uniref:peptidoglycan-binding domain-containing protein n=1 Tax=Schaalia sp. lx-260 TaxID=2899082 RepID=UPI001E4F16BC|nr:peptidoglycan-binding protein [Schaalia sp. lx-260]
MTFALGSTIGAGIMTYSTRTALTPPSTQEQSIPVSAETFDDQRSFSLQVPERTKWIATSPIGGIIRSSSCLPASPLHSGQVAFTIDDSPVIALHLEQPPYRDFTPGMKGDDVQQLQSELARLGFFSESPNGIFGPATVQALNSLKKKAGLDPRSSELSLSEIIWIPSTEVTPESCDVHIGTKVTTDQALFTLLTLPASVTVSLPHDILAGEREALAGDTATIIPSDGVISNQTFIQALYKLSQFSQTLPEGKQISIPTRLVTPISSYRVPPSALYEITGEKACLISDQIPTQVQIIGSSYGNTIVVSDNPLGSITLSPDPKAASCS